MDYILFKIINNLAGKWWFFDFLGIFCAKYLIFTMAFAVVSLLFIWKDKAQKKIHQELILKSFAAVALSYILKTIIQLIYERPRPFMSYEVLKLIDKSADASFPSGHSTIAFALAFSVYFYNKKLGAIFLVFAALVGLGRVFVGVHYPFDVFGGILLGAFSAFVVERFLRFLLSLSFKNLTFS